MPSERPSLINGEIPLFLSKPKPSDGILLFFGAGGGL